MQGSGHDSGVEEREELLGWLARRFGVRRGHVAWLQGTDDQVVARVGVLHFRHREGRNLREWGRVLADAAALSVPPGLA